MLNKRSLALASALTVLPQMVFAAENGQCVSIPMRQYFGAQGGDRGP
jgi:hypothetical protein